MRNPEANRKQMKKLILLLLFINLSSIAQVKNLDTLKRELIEIPTKYGSVRFYKICKDNKAEIQFSFIYGKMDKNVDLEAENSNVKTDTVFV